MKSLKVVGESPERIDGLEKITGAAVYVDDIDFGAKLFTRRSLKPRTHMR